MAKLRSFVLYSADNRVIPMSLLRRPSPPKVVEAKYLEIPRGCCALTPFTPLTGNAKKRLRAFVKMDRKGVVMSGPIIRKNRPKDPTFKEIPYDLCCQAFLQGIVITTQPESQTFEVGENMIFSVEIEGNGTVTYQWYLNGDPIDGETSPTLDLGPATGDDDGNEVYVIVENEAGPITSDTAVITVTAP